MRRRDRTASEIIALLLTVTMTSSACSSGCRSQPPASQARQTSGQADGAQGAASPAAVVTPASPAIPVLDAAATDEALSYIEQVAKQPANAPPDVAAQAASFGRDAAKVFEFVRGEIRYQAYDGVLRGAAGALSGRAANAWDTALLVAELLRTGGFDVRFARGTLPDAMASALVNRMFDQAMRPPGQALSAAGLQPPAAAGAASDAMRARIEANWATNTAEVTAALKRAGIALGTAPPVSEATLLAEARDHVWVEYRDGIQWIPIDPVAASRPGEAAADARETFTEVPEARHHMVTMALGIEQRAGSSVETRSALTLRAPAADLHGRPIILTHQVDIVGSGAWKATPILLVGDKAVGGTSYGPGGVQTADQAGAGGIGGRLNQMFGEAPPASAELTAVWLDVTMTWPDGRVETVRREVVDRLGPAARAARSEATSPLRPVPLADGRPMALNVVLACALTAGPLNAAVLMGRVAAAAPVLRDEALRGRLAKGDTKEMPIDRLEQIGLAVSGALSVLPAAAHQLSQQYAAEAAPALRQPILFYEAAPRLAIATFGPASGGDAPGGTGVSLDLRRNAVRAVGHGVTPAAIIGANIARGVLDGAIEDALVAGDAPVVSTVGVLAEARAKGIAVSASAGGSVTATGWPDDARARLQEDRVSNIVAVMPAGEVAVEGNPRIAWWHIDTRSGEAVGVLDSGLHGTEAVNHAFLWGLMIGASAIMVSDLSFPVRMKVTKAATVFLKEVGEGGKKGWESAKKSW